MTRTACTLIVCACLVLFPRQSARAQAAIADLRKTYEYLVSYRAIQGGALYNNPRGPLKGFILPFSFVYSERYWGDYVCGLSNTNCAVVDVYDPADYAVKPQRWAGAPLRIESADIHN